MVKASNILTSGFYVFFESYLRKLYELIERLHGQLREKSKQLEDAQSEIRRLKNLPKKPVIKPSELDNPKSPNSKKGEKKRPGSEKVSKKAELKIHEERKIKAKDVPTGWKFKGYKPYIIQDLLIRANNINYQREIWQSPDGKQTLVANLPKHLQGKQFGEVLQGYLLHQYYECGVSQPLIKTSLEDYGVLISKGQISNVLIEDKEQFHEEKTSLLAKAIELGEQLRTDDTGARHKFKNGFCNCINSDLFTYFTTTYSKSRINFLEILRLNRTNYEINQSALDYARKEDLPTKYYQVLADSYNTGQGSFENKTALQAYFQIHNWTAKYAIRTITEALLIGSLVAHGFNLDTLLHSDGAGQFNLFAHSLCWKHAERPLVKLVCYNETQQTFLEQKKQDYWLLYQELKKYKQAPDEALIPILEKQFEQLCEPVINYASLNQVLEELKAKKDKLLLVLHRPRTSLHNNDSERDIREYVKRRKISAGTRSENGKKARDTFLSLKKTCRKLGISFWEYLIDRLTNEGKIQPLSLIMEQNT